MKKSAIAIILFALVALVPAVSRAHEGDKTVMGNITKIDGMNVTVKSVDGKDEMVMLNPKTKVNKGTAKVDAKELKVGDRVVAYGREEKSMIAAKTVVINTVPATTK